MTFIVNSIKEGFEKKYSAELVLCVDSSLEARKIIENTGIILLSVKEFKQPLQNF
jgi:hypothetical protein